MVVVALLTLTWMLLCGLPARVTLPSANRTLTIAGANGLILLAIGGWVLGLAGTLGHGVIRVGWVTVGASMMLVTAGVWSRIRDARPASRVAGAVRRRSTPSSQPRDALLADPRVAEHRP